MAVSELQQAKTDLAHNEHIREVAKNLMWFAAQLLDRAGKHDLSKLEEPEASKFAEHQEQLNGLTYGSKEYHAQLDSPALKEAVTHHWANNRHHPQWHKNGVDDMNLIDILEMFCDWEASSKRHNDGNIRKSIEHNAGRFHMTPQLVRIFERTAELFEG